MTVLLATHNPSKIKRFQENVKLPDIDLVSPQELSLPKITVEENGSNEWENAKLKAKAYYQVSKLPSLSLDTGFYINGLAKKDQPGRYVQRIAGVDDNTSDEDRFNKMTKFYIQIAKSLGGVAPAYFLDVFCLLDGKQYHKAEAKRSSNITTQIVKKDVHFPIASIFVDPKSGKYYHNLNQDEMLNYIDPSIKAVQKLLKVLV